MTPRPGPFPRPLASAIPWTGSSSRAGGWGAVSHFRAELSMNQEGKEVGAAEQSQQELAGRQGFWANLSG